MRKINRVLANSFLCAGLFLALAIPGITATHHQAMKSKSEKAVTMTGCFEKGSQAGSYCLVEQNGKKYEVTGTTVALKDHVGQKVTVKGKMMTGSAMAGTTAGEIEASSIRMISSRCTAK